ncbi:MAG TPA: DHHA1 domain-containing protein [Blastocatellia bacterium]|jgi:alanyl-tRNA synthetase|nr:DHHA1 domain-containing protein [Blastocatellia bacterium]
MTTKLYWNDSHLTHFTAVVIDSRIEGGKCIVVLDHTAFYPTGGGQPCDTGLINAARVIDVEISDDGRILHRLNSDISFAVGEEVACEIDWRRRREMIQQHTGQHILSQAFFRLFGAETKGFRITDRSTEIDLTLEAQPDEIESAIARAEELANEVVFDNREIRVHAVTPEEAAALPLRKESFVADCVRVIEIDDYDWSPCGGTHAGRTGEVGLIAVRGWERAKKMTRVHFLCGVRALDDYRDAVRSVDTIARKFSVGREEAESSVARLLEENKRLSRRSRELAGIVASVEAHELIEATEPVDGARIVSRVFEDRDIEELKLLAHRLVDADNVVALLASKESGTARLVFARSANLSADMNPLMRAACERLGGRGGGKPEFAQGGGSKLSELDKALEEAKTILK